MSRYGVSVTLVCNFILIFCTIMSLYCLHRLSVFERKILRKIFGPAKENNGTWRIKTELDELIKYRNVINYVKAQRLSRFGHTNRMPETRTVQKIYKWKPFTRRPVGRPKSRWEDDVKEDLKNMKLIKWVEQVQDRFKWKSIVEMAKTVPELYRLRSRRLFYLTIFSVSIS